MIFKPLLSCEADLTKLRFSLLASAKFDGVPRHPVFLGWRDVRDMS